MLRTSLEDAWESWLCFDNAPTIPGLAGTAMCFVMEAELSMQQAVNSGLRTMHYISSHAEQPRALHGSADQTEDAVSTSESSYRPDTLV